MTEQQRYDVIGTFTGFELRRYPAHLEAEVSVTSSFASAGNQAFGILVGFISGRNEGQRKVAMTAPVVQEQVPDRIAMTAPVVQREAGDSGRHKVAFIMPADYTMESLPKPTDDRITIRAVPEETAAVREFSGRWSEALYRSQLRELLRAVASAGLTASGPVRFARFDPPWTPWFLRRNEIVLPVDTGPAAGPGDSEGTHRA